MTSSFLLYGRKMARNEQDPAANTQQFRAFARGGETAAAKGPNTALIISLIVGALVIIAVVAFLVTG